MGPTITPGASSSQRGGGATSSSGDSLLTSPALFDQVFNSSSGQNNNLNASSSSSSSPGPSGGTNGAQVESEQSGEGLGHNAATPSTNISSYTQAAPTQTQSQTQAQSSQIQTHLQNQFLGSPSGNVPISVAARRRYEPEQNSSYQYMASDESWEHSTEGGESTGLSQTQQQGQQQLGAT